MGLIRSLKRRAAIKRIANTIADHDRLRDETVDTVHHSPEDLALVIDNQYHDRLLYRLDAYYQHSGTYYPRLALDLRYGTDWFPNETDHPGINETVLTWVEMLTPIYKRVEADHENVLERGHSNTLGRSSEIMNNMIGFLLAEGACTTTPEQQYALMSIAYLRLQQQEKEAFRPQVQDSPAQPSIDGWVTVQALSRPTEATAVFDEYRARRRRHNMLTLRFKTVFHHLADQMCDYPDDLIDQLIKMSKSDELYVYSTIDRRLHEGMDEAYIRELVCFAPLLDMNTRNSEKFIMGLSDYDELPRYERYSQAPHHVRDQCLALLLVTDALIDLSRMVSVGNGPRRIDGLKIADKNLVKLLIDNPGQGERIARVIRERKTDDLEIITAATSDALSEGFL